MTAEILVPKRNFPDDFRLVSVYLNGSGDTDKWNVSGLPNRHFSAKPHFLSTTDDP